MKKAILVALVLALFTAVSASAQLNSTATPVALKAVVPEFLSISTTGPTVLNFDFTPLGTTKLADATPSWSLTYNLNNRTVTVCAVATDLLGSGTNKIPAADVYAKVGSSTLPFASTCAGQPNAIQMDQILNAGYVLNKVETFAAVPFITVPGTQAPVPDTYNGTLTVFAQAI